MYINDAMSKIDCIQIPSIDTRGATRGAKYQGGQISPGGVVLLSAEDSSIHVRYTIASTYLAIHYE
jgi:hypothetical protein